MPSGQGLLSTQSDDVSVTVGPFNNEWPGGNLHCGFHKSGFARGPLLRFSNPGIPFGSTINSASITGVVHIATGPDPVVTAVKLLNVDGLWDVASVPAQWTPSVGSVHDWKVELEETGPTQLVISGVADSRSGGVDLQGDNGVQLQRVAQEVVIVTGGNINTARVSLGGSFVPGTGDVWVEIWSDVGGLPGVPLGESVRRPISDIAPKLFAQVRPTYDFTFTGGDIVTVIAAQVVHVVMRTDVAGGGIGVHVGTSNYAYVGDLQPFGVAPDGGFDQQNYLTFNGLAVLPTTGSVAWTITKPLAPKTSPSLVSLIAARLLQVGYNDSSQFGLRVDITGGSGEVIFGAYPGTTAVQFVLDLDWTLPPFLDGVFPKELDGGLAMFALTGGLIAATIVGGLARRALRGGVNQVTATGGIGVDLTGGINEPAELAGGTDC